MKIPDVNVLVHALRMDSPDHERCRVWLEQAVNSPRPIGLVGAVLAGVVRVVTNRRVYTQPSRRQDVLARLTELLGRDHAMKIEPGPAHWGLFQRVCQASDATGNLVADAWLAAIALEQGAVFVTLDRDFAKFADLNWELP